VPLLARWCRRRCRSRRPPSVDVRVLLFAVASRRSRASRSTGARAPGRREPRSRRPARGSRTGGGQRERLRSALVVAEIVASVVLLVTAGLLIRALLAIQAIDPGFKPDGVLTMRTELPMPEYRAVVTREAFYSRVLQEGRALAGVTSAGYVSFLPISSFRGGIWTGVGEGDADAASDTRTANNRGGPFAMSHPDTSTRWRFPSSGEGTSARRQPRPTVRCRRERIVREALLAERGSDRHHFTFAFADREVVGVAGDVRFRGLERQKRAASLSLVQTGATGPSRSYAPNRSQSARPCACEAGLRRSRLSFAGRMRSFRSRSANARREWSISRRRRDPCRCASLSLSRSSRSSWRASAFTVCSRFAVSQRTQEIGVRNGARAQSSDILGMVLRRCVLLALAGVIRESRSLMRRGAAWKRCLPASNRRRAHHSRGGGPLGIDDRRRQHEPTLRALARRSDHGACAE